MDLGHWYGRMFRNILHCLKLGRIPLSSYCQVERLTAIGAASTTYLLRQRSHTEGKVNLEAPCDGSVTMPPEKGYRRRVPPLLDARTVID